MNTVLAKNQPLMGMAQNLPLDLQKKAVAGIKPSISWVIKTYKNWIHSNHIPKETYSEYYLVGGLEHVLFSIIYGIIIPTDFHIFQDG
jgi:hypothetical protein